MIIWHFVFIRVFHKHTKLAQLALKVIANNYQQQKVNHSYIIILWASLTGVS